MQRTLTDVENNEVRNWNVQQVLMWLKHTSSGMFEEYCPIFQENHVHGEALLSLNNEILRDEFEIKSYGKRFELLKAIQKLAKKSTSSSKGSLSNKSPQRISQTYYKGMAANQTNSAQTIGSIKNDNWENLEVIAAQTNIIDSNQYSKMVHEITSDITGTEISQQTREKHSFYRKLSNLSSQQKKSTLTKPKAIIPVNKSGGYQFDINMPNWDTIPITKVMQHSWDGILRKWIAKVIYVKIAPLPFSRGSLRMSYYCLNLGTDINEQNIKQQTNSKDSIKIASEMNAKNDTNTNNTILFNKLIGNKNVFGGKLCVAKRNFGICDSIEAYFYDVRTQCESQKFANQYNKHQPPKKVAFLQASVIEVMDDEEKIDDLQFYCLESFLHGSYIKHIDNHGGDEKARNTPSAFAHFSYEASNKRLLVCDIQGVGDLYTDPQIHTVHGLGFGLGNLGNDGIIKFFKTHECNAICKHFKFKTSSSLSSSYEDLIYGTRPEHQYMQRKKIEVVDTSYLDDNKYLMQIPPLFHKNITNLPSPPAPIINYNYNHNTNINVMVSNSNEKRRTEDERARLLADYEPRPPDSEGCCCRCVIL